MSAGIASLRSALSSSFTLRAPQKKKYFRLGVLALLALAIGCGSLFFNYANHAGFWMVKESFGMSMGEATKTITVVQSIVSFVGLLMVLLFNLLPKLG